MYPTDENKLIRDILNGDSEAYAVLVNRYQRPIFNMLLRMTGCREEATDLTQDTFLRAYEKLERFQPAGRFFPWLYTIGLNLARDHLRRQRRAATTAHLDFAVLADQDQHTGQHRLVGQLDALRLRQLMGGLPEAYREALILRFHEGLPMKEVGAALGISASGAKMRVKRGLERLRKMLKCRGISMEETSYDR